MTLLETLFLNCWAEKCTTTLFLSFHC